MKLVKSDVQNCYIISENRDIDQRVISINDALNQAGGDQPTIFVFGEAELIYFEGEPPKNRYISEVI